MSSAGPASSRASSSRSSTSLRHPIGLRLHPRHRVRRVRRDRLAAALGELGVAADGGQRVAQLVRRVGHELPDLRLARLPGGQRLLDVVEHVVEREPDPADLGIGMGVGRRHPDGEGDLTAVQRQLRHLLRRGRDPVEGTQAAFDQRAADQRGGPDGEDGQHDLHRDQVGQGRVHLGERQPHRVRDRAVVARPADDAIPTELGQVDRGGPSDGGLGGELVGCLVVGPGRLGPPPVVLQHDRLGLLTRRPRSASACRPSDPRVWMPSGGRVSRRRTDRARPSSPGSSRPSAGSPAGSSAACGWRAR